MPLQIITYFRVKKCSGCAGVREVSDNSDERHGRVALSKVMKGLRVSSQPSLWDNTAPAENKQVEQFPESKVTVTQRERLPRNSEIPTSN